MQLRLGFFGASGSGKTSLLASYYGTQQTRKCEKEKGFHLLASSNQQGEKLLQRYFGMRDGKFPDSTSMFEEYFFNFHLTGIEEDPIQISWYDYPGGWWGTDPTDALDLNIRKKAFVNLLSCHVAFLVIDGIRLGKEKAPYLRSLLSQFRNVIKKQRKLIHDNYGEEELKKYPKEWAIAMTKADAYRSLDAKKFAHEMIKAAGSQLEELADEIGDGATLGKKFLILSAAEGTGDQVTDINKTIGLELIAPIAVRSTIEHLIESSRKHQNEIEQRVANKVKEVGSGGLFGKALKAAKNLVENIDKFDDFLPVKWQIITQILKEMGLKDILNEEIKAMQASSEAEIKVIVADKEKRIASLKKSGKVMEAATEMMLKEIHAGNSNSTYFDTRSECTASDQEG
ncbi:MAG: hypothetical protein PHQ23_15175 [Candidatus Wallbacteria bacterium]|nr:hypothetical protein [Candidatus Wallbacteria bacterium]